MARVVDPVLEAQRQRVLEALGQSQHLVEQARSRCQELQQRTWAQVSGTVVGDSMVGSAVRMVDGVAGIIALLGDASSAASAIDVTVDVPDEEAR